ncbi:MAG TPA: error-prone DNA polymerase [Chitinophagaceae bacterium]|nr:error-prone DNA polymerase [Chitinophagaceae bacterium]
MTYTELHITTNFSFLEGGSHPEEFVTRAAELGYQQIGVADRNTLAGIVRAHSAAKEQQLRLIIGCRLQLLDGPALLAYPQDRQAYSRLSALLTTGNLRVEKGSCHLYRSDVYDQAHGMKLIVVPPPALNAHFEFEKDFIAGLAEYKENFGSALYLAASRRYNGHDQKYLFRLAELSRSFEVPLVATNDVHYHHPGRRQLQDVLTCVREKCTIRDAGFRLYPNAERWLKPQQEMLRLFHHYPEAIRSTQEIAEACRFSLNELKYEYPEELTSEGRSPQEELTRLTWQGAAEKFGDRIPQRTRATIVHELRFIEEMNYANYFLTVHDIVRFARSRGILCQGRGSAANSTVCFCLGITSVDPTKFDLLFERFLSSARNEPPDIDVDFEHERREEVIQYIYEKYGRDRAAIVATVTQERQKGAIRDVGRAMGLSVDTLNRLSASISGFGDEWFDHDRLAEHGFDVKDKLLRKVLELTAQLMGFPRQLGQHTGGFVITNGKLTDLCPILNARMENRTCIEWNKDDIDALSFLKVDVLALGMLTCIRKAFDLARQHYGLDLTLANIPQDDPAVYDMICRADTIGVFQIESRAQMAMLPRLKPRNFYDLVIEVAIVRPGPIQGDMVHPYLKRRNGEEPVEYPSTELEEILGRTLGVPLFQEQVMKIAIVAAGFTPAEADALRRSMATFRMNGEIAKFEKKLLDGMLKNGYSHDYGARIVRQLEGFGSYGFPESHAASFAHLVYVSAWIKCHYPDLFACALLNSLPMGFYQPAQIVSDARKHHVPLAPVDVNYSCWDNTLEPNRVQDSPMQLRLGFRQVKAFRQQDADLLVGKRKEHYRRIQELRDIGVSKAALEKLADADAFRSMGLDRRQALWEVSAAYDQPTGIFTGQDWHTQDERQVSLPQMQPSEHVVHDYAATSLSIKAHPVSFIRDRLDQLHMVPAVQLGQYPDGKNLKLAGLVLVRQRPGTAKGVVFITLEDETGSANIVVFPNVFQKFRKAVLGATLLMVEGKLQVEEEVIHLIAEACYDISEMLRLLNGANEKVPNLLTLSRADQGPSELYPPREKTQPQVFDKSRNFK